VPLERGLATHLVEGTEIVKAMAHQAERVVVLADLSKFMKAGFVSVLPLSEIDRLITDSGLAAKIIKQLEDEDVHIVVV
jgi:DeoR/GlpR family transcriptional regulator of sugar metabolism